MAPSFSFGDAVSVMAEAPTWDAPTFSSTESPSMIASPFLVSPALTPKDEHGVDAPFTPNEPLFHSFNLANQFGFPRGEFHAFDDDEHAMHVSFPDMVDTMFHHHSESLS